MMSARRNGSTASSKLANRDGFNMIENAEIVK